MPATKQRRTREAILQRAVDLASEEGLEGLTIGRLASEMEMSKSGLFGHFGSKEELQLATIDAARRRFIEEVIAPVQSQAPGAARLQRLCDLYLAYMERQVFPGGCFWGTVSAEFDNRPGPVRDAVCEGLASWIELLRSEARAAGYDDPAQVAFEVHSIAQGANSAFQLFADPGAFERARIAIRRVLTR
jgi:AcrR family transcriptional regulator